MTTTLAAYRCANGGLRQFLLRGLETVRTEWQLACLALKSDGLGRPFVGRWVVEVEPDSDSGDVVKGPVAVQHWNDKPLGLKAFLDELRQYCDDLSREELIRTLIELSAETPPQERPAFLRHFAELAEGRVQVDDPFDDGDFPPAVTSVQREELLTLLDALLIAARHGETFQIARSTQPVGWTTGESAGALCFAAILAYRARSSLEHCPTIRQSLSQHVTQTRRSSSRFVSTDPDEENDESSALPAGVQPEHGDKAGHRGEGSPSNGPNVSGNSSTYRPMPSRFSGRTQASLQAR